MPEALRELAKVDLNDRQQIDRWAKRGFTDGWARDTALTHERRWREHPELRGHWLSVAVGYWAPIPPTFSWDPTKEAEAQNCVRYEKYIEEMKQLSGIESAGR